ncbi:MAG: PAS domain-containing protein [Bacteroidota bacterium]
MIYKEEEIYSLLQSIEGIVWEADAELGLFTFISDRIRAILGFSPEDWLGRSGFWESCIHPDDRNVITGYKKILNGKYENRSFEYRIIKADGHIVWVRDRVSITFRDGKPFLIRGIMLDITITERLQEIERLEGHILRLNSELIVPLDEVLTTYLKGLEALFPQMLSCIYRVKNHHLVNGLSPSLHPSYISSMTGLSIGENEGSCGAAAALKQQVIVGDIASDPKWDKYKSIAMGYQLHACWSNPVIDTDGEVIATVSMYYRKPKLPGDEELKVMERATALLRIILENRQKTDIINETNLLMLQNQELAHFGNWRWDIQLDIVNWSPVLYTIYGLDPKEFKATFAGYQERLHPEDRDRVYQIIENILTSKETAEFEERIIRPDGEVRYLRSWAKLKCDQNNVPVEMIGACLDITEKVSQTKAIERRNRQLTEIAWVQSHLIRSPLTKVIALVNLIKDNPAGGEENDTLLNYLLSSAQELDEQINNICKGIKP